MLDKLNQQGKEAQENARRLAELEKIVHGEQLTLPPVVANNNNDPSGCLWCLGCLVSLGVMAVVVSVVWVLVVFS